MKEYETFALLKKEVLHRQLRFDKFESALSKAERGFERLQAYHKAIEEESLRDIRNIEANKVFFFDYLQEGKQALRTFRAPKAKPKPKALNGNGKKKCPICLNEFSAKGYPAHVKKCERLKEEEIRVDLLKKELESDLEGEE